MGTDDHENSTNPGIAVMLSPGFDYRFFNQRAFGKGLLVRASYWTHLNLVYVRVPKCGNQSIRAAIPGGRPLILDPYTIDNRVPRPFVFSFVRNPWDRLVSTWAEKIRPARITDEFFDNGVSRVFIRSGLPVYPSMPFAEFVEMACDMDDSETENHLRSQSFFLVREEAPFPDFIGRCEDFSTDWNRLLQCAGLDLELPHINKSVRSDYAIYYDDRLAERVTTRYENDISMFGYRFDI